MKSEHGVRKGIGSKVEEPHLLPGIDPGPDVGVLARREPRLFQERAGIDAFIPEAGGGKPGHDPACPGRDCESQGARRFVRAMGPFSP